MGTPFLKLKDKATWISPVEFLAVGKSVKTNKQKKTHTKQQQKIILAQKVAMEAIY